MVSQRHLVRRRKSNDKRMTYGVPVTAARARVAGSTRTRTALCDIALQSAQPNAAFIQLSPALNADQCRPTLLFFCSTSHQMQLLLRNSHRLVRIIIVTHFHFVFQSMPESSNERHALSPHVPAQVWD